MLRTWLTVLAASLCLFLSGRPAGAVPAPDDGGICSPAAYLPDYAGPDVPGRLLLRASDGHQVQSAIVVPQGKPKGLIVIIPGAWFGRDDSHVELANQLADRGFASARFRQRCHLRFLALETFKDIEALLAAAREKVPVETPLYLLGHSRGAWYIMRGISLGIYKPAGTIFIAGGQDDLGHYNDVLHRIDLEIQGLKKSIRAAPTPELKKKLQEAQMKKKNTEGFFKKLKRGELADDATIPGDLGAGKDFPPTTAAQFRDENELKDPKYERKFLKTGTPTLLIVGSEDREYVKTDFRRFAGKFPPEMGTFFLLQGFDHGLRDATQHVPKVLSDTIANWIQDQTTKHNNR